MFSIYGRSIDFIPVAAKFQVCSNTPIQHLEHTHIICTEIAHRFVCQFNRRARTQIVYCVLYGLSVPPVDATHSFTQTQTQPPLNGLHAIGNEAKLHVLALKLERVIVAHSIRVLELDVWPLDRMVVVVFVSVSLKFASLGHACVLVCWSATSAGTLRNRHSECNLNVSHINKINHKISLNINIQQ